MASALLSPVERFEATVLHGAVALPAPVPPAHVALAGFDVLRDEGEEYAERLRRAGVPVTVSRHTGLLHRFANMVGLGRASRVAMGEVAGALRAGLVAA